MEKSLTDQYKNMIRRTDQAVMNLFNDLSVVCEKGERHSVPCLWGTEERCLAAITTTKTTDEGATIDSVKLPMVSVYSVRLHPDFDPEYEREKGDPVQFTIRYQIFSHNMWREEANQIIEQMLFNLGNPVFVDQGDGWVTRITLNHVDFHGEKQAGHANVIKDQFVVYAEVNYKRAD